MKTLTTITYIQELPANQRSERTESFIRGYGATKPTLDGAARMVARRINDETGASVKPSDITISGLRIQDYATR